MLCERRYSPLCELEGIREDSFLSPLNKSCWGIFFTGHQFIGVSPFPAK